MVVLESMSHEGRLLEGVHCLNMHYGIRFLLVTGQGCFFLSVKMLVYGLDLMWKLVLFLFLFLRVGLLVILHEVTDLGALAPSVGLIIIALEPDGLVLLILD